MKFTTLLFLYMIAAGVLLLPVVSMPAPAYMDADYYYAGGLNLARGRGFSELFLWNYLDQPTGIPHTGFTYWMPLTSLLASLGMIFTGSYTYMAARLVLILLAAAIAPLTGWLAFSYSGRESHAWVAGLLGISSGYYLTYLASTSTFTLTMLLGTAYILLSSRMLVKRENRALMWTAALLGITAGLIHLNRADGLIWIVIALGIIILASGKSRPVRRTILSLAACLGAYLLITGPWYVRNILVYGSIFPEGSNLSLWFTGYDDLYFLDTSLITPERWLASGLNSIVLSRLNALGQNLLRAFAVQGQIFLLPLMILGGWKLWKLDTTKIAAFAWVVILLLMSFVFPFAGMRGGFFHSAAMVQPVLWSLVPVGLGSAIDFGVKKRGWVQEQAWKSFSVGIVAISFIITAGVFLIQLNGQGPISEQGYQSVGDLMESLSIPSDETIMVNNPPGFYVTTSRPAVVIPSGGTEVVLRAARQYQVEYLILDQNNADYLEDLYQNPSKDPNFMLLGEAGSMNLYQIKP